MADTTTTPRPTDGLGASQDQGASAQAKDKAQEVAGQAQEKAQELAGQAKQQAGQAKEQLRTQVDQRSTQAGQTVNGHASDLRSVSEQLRQQGKEQPAKLADQAAERLERAGGWLTNADADRILGDVEDFARRNPMAVLAGGLALGFAASRMLKASSTDRYRVRTVGYDGRALPARTGEQRFTRPESAYMPSSTPPMPVSTPPAPPIGTGAPGPLDPVIPPRPTGPGTL